MDTEYVEVITWLDHQTDKDGWQDVETAAKFRPATCISIGWVVSEDKNVLVIAPTYSTCSGTNVPEVVTDHMAVIKSTIVGRQRVRLKRLTQRNGKA